MRARSLVAPIAVAIAAARIALGVALPTTAASVLSALSARAGAAEESGEAIERRYESGPVAVELVVKPAKPVIGDVVELQLEARAEPGVELLMPEFGEAEPGTPGGPVKMPIVASASREMFLRLSSYPAMVVLSLRCPCRGRRSRTGTRRTPPGWRRRQR